MNLGEKDIMVKLLSNNSDIEVEWLKSKRRIRAVKG